MTVQLPTSASELGHIFRHAGGHLRDTTENRRLLLDVANDAVAQLESDQFGNRWAARVLPDNRQVWVRMRGDKIINAGVNVEPRGFDPETGLNRP
jgi:filamentous hemagglutinin